MQTKCTRFVVLPGGGVQGFLGVRFLGLGLIGFSLEGFPRGITRAPPPSSAPTLPPATTSRPPLLGPTAPPFPPPPPVQEDTVTYYTRLLRQLEAAITLMEALGQEVPNWPYSHLLILESKGGIPSARPSSVATGSGEARPTHLGLRLEGLGLGV